MFDDSLLPHYLRSARGIKTYGLVDYGERHLGCYTFQFQYGIHTYKIDSLEDYLRVIAAVHYDSWLVLVYNNILS